MPSLDERRPATVVTALALTALTGLANALVGAVVLSLIGVGALPIGPGLSRPVLLTTGWTYLLLGALTLVAAFRLFGHKPGSRVFVTVVMTLRIAAASISFAAIGTWYSVGSIIGIVISLVVIALLWDSRANAYFHRAP